MVLDNFVAAFIPMFEVTTDAPCARVTSFEHDGDYGLYDSPWQGDVEPAVADGLFCL